MCYCQGGMQLLGFPVNIGMKDLVTFSKNNFQKYDENEDGQLTFNEITNLLGNLGNFFRKTTSGNNAWKLKLTVLETIFILMDESNDGNLSVGEFREFVNKIIKGKGKDLLKDFLLNEVFHFVDKDMDGFITNADVMNTINRYEAGKRVNLLVKTMLVTTLFGMVDKNQDGKILKNEIRKALFTY